MIKSTSVVFKVDELDRIVIPIELRCTMGIEEKMLLKPLWIEKELFLKQLPNLSYMEERSAVSLN